MSKINSDELVDIFKEEVTRKEKKDLKKKKQLEKKLEKKENIEFEKIAKEEEKRKQETALKNKVEENNSTEKLDKNNNLKTNDFDKISVHSFLYDTMFGFFLVLLFICTLGYCLFLLHNSIDKNNIIKCTLLSLFMIFYIISLTNKKQGLKMFAAIISSAAICLLMIFLIYSI